LGVPALRRSGYPLNLFIGAKRCPNKKDTASIPNALPAKPAILKKETAAQSLY